MLRHVVSGPYTFFLIQARAQDFCKATGKSQKGGGQIPMRGGHFSHLGLIEGLPPKKGGGKAQKGGGHGLVRL